MIGESREKYWEELTNEEKIELLGDRLIYLQRIVNQAGEVIQKLQNHVHVNDRIFWADGPVSPMIWPNENILRKKK